jgi:hypothetical protein
MTKLKVKGYGYQGKAHRLLGSGTTRAVQILSMQQSASKQERESKGKDLKRKKGLSKSEDNPLLLI